MKLIKLAVIVLLIITSKSLANNFQDFDEWKLNFKKKALANNISEKTFNVAMMNVKFLPKVIEYDRFQPEFYEDKNIHKQKII